MSKISNKPPPLLGWCSGNKDNRESRFVQLGVSFFENDAVKKLTGSEFKLYALMVKVAGLNRDFSLPRAVYKSYFSPSTFQGARDGLIRKGFIETVYSGKSTIEPSRYRFTFSWKATP